MNESSQLHFLYSGILSMPSYIQNVINLIVSHGQFKCINENGIEYQTEEQLDIETAQEHYDYIVNLEEKTIFIEMNKFNKGINKQKKEYKLTKELTHSLNMLNQVADEYLNYINELDSTEQMHLTFRKAMIELRQWVTNIKAHLKNGTYVKSIDIETQNRIAILMMNTHCGFDMIGIEN